MTFLTAAAAALLAAATPGPIRAEADAAKSEPTTSKSTEAEKLDPMKFLSMFDKIFPAGPEPEPQRLALSRTATKALLADGTYVRAMDDVMGGIVDRMLDIDLAQFGEADKKGKNDLGTMRDSIRKDDPHFDQRMGIVRKIAAEEMAKLSIYIEPKLREGLARSLARRLDARQLTDLNAFLATDSGRAFGRETMTMWIDADVMRSMVMSTPDILMALPGAMKRIEESTAHLPKPKKKKAEAKK
jgi:hypothetical protein